MGSLSRLHPGPAWTTAIIKQYVAVWMERGLNTAPNPSTQFMFYLESNFNMKAMYNVELVEQCRSVLIFKNRERPVWLRVFTCRLKLHFPVWKVRSNIFTFSFKFSVKFSCNLDSIWEQCWFQLRAMGTLLSIFLCHLAFISFFINLNGKGNMPPPCPSLFNILSLIEIFHYCLPSAVQRRGEDH